MNLKSTLLLFERLKPTLLLPMSFILVYNRCRSFSIRHVCVLGAISGQSGRREVQAGEESSKTLNLSSEFRDASLIRNIIGIVSLQAHGCWEVGKGLIVEGIPDT